MAFSWHVVLPVTKKAAPAFGSQPRLPLPYLRGLAPKSVIRESPLSATLCSSLGQSPLTLCGPWSSGNIQTERCHSERMSCTHLVRPQRNNGETSGRSFDSEGTHPPLRYYKYSAGNTRSLRRLFLRQHFSKFMEIFSLYMLLYPGSTSLYSTLHYSVLAQALSLLVRLVKHPMTLDSY